MDSKVKKILTKLSKERVELNIMNDAREITQTLRNYTQDLEAQSKTVRGQIRRVVQEYYELEERYNIANRLRTELARKLKEIGFEPNNEQVIKELDRAIRNFKSLDAATKLGPLLKI